MVEHETIKWGMFDETPHIRGEKHIKYLLKTYNKGKKKADRVHDINELLIAMKKDMQNQKP